MIRQRFQQAKAGLRSARRQAQRVGDELRDRLRNGGARDAAGVPFEPPGDAAATSTPPSPPQPCASAESSAPLEAGSSDPDSLEAAPDEPPVVARMMVEIRSDGTRTIARGAIQDQLSGEQVSLVAEGNSPLELAGQLLKSLVTTPLAAGDLAKAMLKARRPPKS